MGLEPMSLTSVALMAQYQNVRQRKWGIIIIQTVHILQLDSADTSSLPKEDFFKHIPNYFQITQPGSSTVTPPYQWRRLNFQVKFLKMADDPVYQNGTNEYTLAPRIKWPIKRHQDHATRLIANIL